jgi:hypothetical protein
MLKIDSKRLHDMLEKDLVAEFGHIAGRTTLRDARNAVLMGDGAEQCKVESDN